MRRLARPLRVTLLTLAAVTVVLGFAYRSWLSSQARGITVLAVTLDAPLVRWAAEVLTGEPRVEDTVVAGVPTIVARPAGKGPWPALVFINGATARGRHHPAVQRLAHGVARAGYVVLVPDVPGLADFEITRRTLAGTVAVARSACARDDVRGGQVAFAGVSAGATLALLAAADPAVAECTTVVAGVAPYTDLAQVVRLATTGFYKTRQGLIAYDADTFLGLVVARSLVSGLRRGDDKDALLAHLRAVPDDARDPLAGLRAWPREGLGPDARALVELLSNLDPDRFDPLYKALPAPIRAGIARLSPIRRAERIQARVLLVSAPSDKYFPLEESRALLARVPNGRLTVTGTLEHAVPRPTPSGIADLFRFYGYLVRALDAARATKR